MLLTLTPALWVASLLLYVLLMPYSLVYFALEVGPGLRSLGLDPWRVGCQSWGRDYDYRV